jgi:V8-like Glu-specific endopeptidase
VAIQLSSVDFQQLLSMVQALPDFGTERDRRRLVAAALEGVPKSDVILARLDLSGPPMSAAVEVIRFLASFGQVAYGKEALGVFLNYLQPFLGDEATGFIAHLFANYPLNALVNGDLPLNSWRGTDGPEDIREKIIGENTLRHVNYLELALEAAKAVVHLCVTNHQGQQSLGTGFMVASDMIMTNNHVIASETEASTTEYSFNYQLGRDGKLLEVALAQAMPKGLFYTNPDLDYTVIQLANAPGSAFGYLKLNAALVHKDDRVAIIQHPGGHLKKISMQNNFVAYADRQVVQYTTSTLPGSSGSPVFNDKFEVVAIHHSGGMLVEPGSGHYHLRNAGTSTITILDDLKKSASAIHAKLRGGWHD